MSLFNFSEPEILTFFAVLVRFATIIAVLPVFGDRFVPGPAKVLFALAVTIALFPALLATGEVKPVEALAWARSAGGIAGTIALEAFFGLALGYTARLIFDVINFGGNLAGQFMGFGVANTFDPHTESQTQVVAEIQMAIAMLLFLAIDGHHLMLQAALSSYGIVGLGKAGVTAATSARFVEMTGDVLRFGLQITAPVALALFTVNIAFGVVAKALPQLNVLVLSFAVTSFVGLVVLLIALPEFTGAVTNLFERVGDWLNATARAMATG